MRTAIERTDVYKWDELTEEAQESAIQNLHDINVNYEDWDEFVLDDAKEIGNLMGIDISNIYYSGFSSQGDGACFEGEYHYKKGSVKAVKEYAPLDTELHRIVSELYELQRRNFYRLSAYVKQRGHYYHELCTSIDVNEANTDETEEALRELLRDYMRWIYKQLNNEYDYLTSRETIIETIKANEYEFTEEGRLY